MTDGLDARLLAALSLVRAGRCAADIGCDHGKLSVQLIKSGVCPKVIAADLRPGPLAAAGRLVRQEGLTQQIDCRLGDGLSVVHPGEVQDIIIAGMGGETIAAILADAPWTKDEALHFVFVPATAHEKLRSRLCEAGFSILKELPVEENGHWYTVMSVCYTGVCRQVDSLFAAAGLVTGQKSQAAAGYLGRVLARLQKELAGKMHSGRYHDLTELQTLIGRLEKEVEKCQE